MSATAVKPASGRVRWVHPIEGSSPGVLQINGVPYTVLPESAGFRLINHQSGAEYDIDTTLDPVTCDCGDYTYRRAGVDPRGCKHVAALRVALTMLPSSVDSEEVRVCDDSDVPF